MARRLLSSCGVSVVIMTIGAATLLAQTRQPDSRQDTRIAFLLAYLAEQSRQSEDIRFAVRAQAQAALMLWPYDRDRAQSIFRRAFESLSPSRPVEEESKSRPARPARFYLPPTLRQQLREELLNQIASRDAELAEELARTLVDRVEASSDCEQAGGASTCGSVAAPAERRELLVSVALHLVERDPQRAMRLGQLSLASGISPNLARLAVLMRGVDARLGDLLFSSALERIEGMQAIALSDIHTLGSYVVSVADSSANGSLSRRLVERFLSLASHRALNRVSQNADEATEIYLIGRQLRELYARYLPDRLDQLKGRLSEPAEAGPLERVIEANPPQGNGPSDIARQAQDIADERERDALYARAALGWLARREVSEAQAAAAKISDARMRDRVLAQVARSQTSEGRIDDALAVAHNIESDAARVDVLIRLASAALSSNDRARARELLDDAEREALNASPSISSSRALLMIVSCFSAFDLLRAFEVMQATVKSINDMAGAAETQQKAAADLYDLNFDGTLSVLARADFDRALLLAQQLTGKEASVIAQLAVCRGGLTRRTAAEHYESQTGTAGHQL